MRPLALLTFALALLGAGVAEARLFLQTYGSVVPADPCGNGCTWNWNQDYFVPRYCSSCRYGLFSPCKTSCTKSPACHYCHAMMPGYCSTYGPWHYCRRNHVYRCHCGCGPVPAYCGPYRHGCGHCCRHGYGPCLGCRRMACCQGPALVTGMFVAGLMEYGEPLANVEPPHFEVLGYIPVEGDELLASSHISRSVESLPGAVLPPAEEHLPKFGPPLKSVFPITEMPEQPGTAEP